jgi:AAA15 family ATPase/GTPase
MHKIDNIEIKNFKSIRHQKIEGCKRINIFIGAPNVGKSNILEAIGLFSIDNEATLFSDFVRTGKCTTLFFNATIEAPVQVIINNCFRVKINYDKGGLFCSVQEDRFNEGFENVDNEIANADVIIISDVRDKLLVRASFSVSEDNKKIGNYNGDSNLRIYNSLVEDKARETSSKKVSILKYEFKKNVQYDSKYAWRLKHPHGENIFEIISTNEDLNKSIIEILSDYGLKFLYDSEVQEYKILKIIGNKIFTVPYSMTADTLQRLFFYKTATLSNKNSILLFEEPEAHMYPPYISKFTSDMMYDDNGNQFFIATHSSYVINDIMENLKKDDYSIYTLGYDKETGETLIRKMTDEELHEIYQYGVDLFLNLENYLPHAQQQ